MVKQAFAYKYSICIPSRNRIDTLLQCLESLTAIHRDDVQFIVSLNGYSDLDLHTITKFASNLSFGTSLTLLRPPTLLSMVKNFEHCLSSCKGSYISFIGDDDCFVSDALSLADSHYTRHPSSVLTWYRWPYYWPGAYRANASLYVHKKSPLIQIDTQSLILDMAHAWPDYSMLPSIYNSFVPANIIASVVRSNYSFGIESGLADNLFWPTGGVVSVDVYSAFAIIAFIECFFFSLYPLSLSGISKYSNGMNASEFKRFAQELGKSSPQELVDSRLGGPSISMTFCMSTDLLHASKRYYSKSLKPLNARLIAKLSLLRAFSVEASSNSAILKDLARIAAEFGLDVSKLTEFMQPIISQKSIPTRQNAQMALLEQFQKLAKPQILDPAYYGCKTLLQVSKLYPDVS